MIRKIGSFLLYGAAAFLIAKTLYLIFSVTYHVPIPFDTDEADHANAALELYTAIKSFSPIAIWHAVVRQAFYPPLHSFFVSLAYGLGGSVSLFTSRFPSFLFLIASILLLGKTAAKIGLKTSGNFYWIFSVIGLLFLESPILIENAALCMLELLGVCIVCAIIFCATFDSRKKQIVWITFLCFLLTLTKYSFAAMIVPACFAWMFFSAQAPTILQRIKAVLIPGGVFFAATAAWVMSTRTESVLKFFTSHPSYAPLLSSENIFFEIRSWIFSYQGHACIGIITLLLFAVSLVQLRPAAPIRLSHLLVANSLGVLLLSSTNEVRHFIVAAPALWLAATYVLSHPYANTPAHRVLRTLFLLSLILVGFRQLPSVKRFLINGMEGRVEYDELANAVIRNANLSAPVLLVGTFDQLGIETIQWYAAKASGVPYSHIDFDLYPYRVDKNITQQIRSRNIDRWFSDPTFPTELDPLLATHYYKTIALIRSISAKDNSNAVITKIIDAAPAETVKRKIFADKELIVLNLK